MKNLILNIIDFLKGNKVKSFLYEIKEINSDFDAVTDFQNKRIDSLINSIRDFTPFYNGYGKVENFKEFPVINKNIINSNRDKFKNVGYNFQKLKMVSTSGSTGVPFKVYHNEEKINRQLADNFFFSELCGHLLGQRLYYIRIWNEINNLSLLERKLKNIVQVNTAMVNESMVIDLLNKLSKDEHKKSILAYSSSLEAIAQLIKIKKIIIPPISKLSCIITMAEALSIETKVFLEANFNTKVYSRYSNSENGFFAHQIPGFGNYYKINNASFKVEILDLDKDEELPYGESGRIVITDFFNYAFPMIRYDTGDIGSMDIFVDENETKHLVLTKIEGRRLDFIKIKDKMISPHTVDYALRSFDKLKQFQLILKKDKSFELLLNANEALNQEDCETIANRLKVYLGENIVLNIKIVSSIPLLASGKRKIVQIEN